MDITAIIGLGGSGGWIAQLLAKSDAKNTRYMLIDGDMVEEKNMDRQLVDLSSVGTPKVQVMERVLKNMRRDCVAHTEFIAVGSPTYEALLGHKGAVRILCCVDNHPARAVCLKLADARHDQDLETVVVIAGNEYETASAQVYQGLWAGGPLDPRVMFPEILTDTEGDPLRPNCTGEELESSPQLALSNMVSAASAAWLYRFWAEVRPTLKAEADEENYALLVKTFPIFVDWTNGRQKTKVVADFLED